MSGCLSIEDVALNKMNAAPEVLALRRAYILIRGSERKGTQNNISNVSSGSNTQCCLGTVLRLSSH